MKILFLDFVYKMICCGRVIRIDSPNFGNLCNQKATLVTEDNENVCQKHINYKTKIYEERKQKIDENNLIMEKNNKLLA